MSARSSVYLRLAAEGAATIIMLTGLGCMVADQWQAAALCFLWAPILSPTSWNNRPRLKKNQAIVTAPVEPSSDMRQAAHAVTELRVSLIAAGYTPEQASRQIADIVAAQNRPGS